MQTSHCGGFSLRSAGSRHMGFRSCSTWAQQLRFLGPRALAQQLWHRGLAVPQYMGSSRTRGQTCVSCVSRQILHNSTTRGALNMRLPSVLPWCPPAQPGLYCPSVNCARSSSRLLDLLHSLLSSHNQHSSPRGLSWDNHL